MAKKKSKLPGIPNFFPPLGPHYPIGNILAAGANIATYYGLQRFSREVAKLMGVSGASIEAEIALNRSKVSLARQETELAKVKALSERQIRLLDIRIAEKELDMDRAR